MKISFSVNNLNLTIHIMPSVLSKAINTTVAQNRLKLTGLLKVFRRLQGQQSQIYPSQLYPTLAPCSKSPSKLLLVIFCWICLYLFLDLFTYFPAHVFIHQRVILGFPGDSAGKESACNAGDLGSIPGLRRSGEGKGYPLQYSSLENSMDYGVTKSWT